MSAETITEKRLSVYQFTLRPMAETLTTKYDPASLLGRGVNFFLPIKEPAAAVLVATAATDNNKVVSDEIVARAKAGDNVAFADIFTAYQPRVYGHLRRLTHSAEGAEDMTQDTFLKAYTALPKTSEGLRIGAWLHRIATNVFLDEKRHSGVLKWQPWEEFVAVFHPSQVAGDDPEREFISREGQEKIQSILNKLPPRYRACLVLRGYYDLSYDEIADVFGGNTRSTVKSLLFRARQVFKQVYTQAEKQPDGQSL